MDIKFAIEKSNVIIHSINDIEYFEDGTPFFTIRLFPKNGSTLKDFKSFLRGLTASTFNNSFITGIGTSESLKLTPFMYAEKIIVLSDELMEFNGKDFTLNKGKLVHSMISSGWEII